jgi:hypothetical protein
MNKLYEMVMFVAVCSIPISLMGIAAFLIYKQVDGWGWFLLCALMISGSLRAKIG